MNISGVWGRRFVLLPWFGGVPVLVAAIGCLFAQSATAIVFTNSITIAETNASFDGQDIIVSGATVAIDGPHGFNSLLLTNGAVLTHSACTVSETRKLDLIVSNSITVDRRSRIDVTAKGY